jgi:hypothetical protein
MALEVAASIFSIIAAAGKVAKILRPVVSAFQDITKHTTAVLSEVNSSRIILAALQRYLLDLNINPQARRDLIPIDQLVTTYIDGVLLFSELEALVIKAIGVGNEVPDRMRRVMNDQKFTSFVSRLQGFKSAITAMLNILQW